MESQGAPTTRILVCCMPSLLYKACLILCLIFSHGRSSRAAAQGIQIKSTTIIEMRHPSFTWSCCCATIKLAARASGQRRLAEALSEWSLFDKISGRLHSKFLCKSGLAPSLMSDFMMRIKVLVMAALVLGSKAGRYGRVMVQPEAKYD